ncbi:hypothetical protein [Stutzerimonas xanthomarina]|uniref:hypothetical protein n=1 Tax=Stutzerimonas xanthomarina TaxID=271420 RepID=UPI003AA8CCAE
MTATAHLRGHKIEWDALLEHWVYADTRQPTATVWQERPCGHCGQHNTPEGHDACLGTLPGVTNACCGHGDERLAYIQYTSGTEKRGADAIAAFKQAEIDHHRA